MSKKNDPPARLDELRRLETLAVDTFAPLTPPLCAPPPARTETSLSNRKYWPVFLAFAQLGLYSVEVRFLRGKDLDLSENPTLTLEGDHRPGGPLRVRRKRIWVLSRAQAESLRFLAARPPTALLIPVGTEPERIHDACRWISYKAGLSRLLSYDQLRRGYNQISRGIGPKPLVL